MDDDLFEISSLPGSGAACQLGFTPPDSGRVGQASELAMLKSGGYSL